MMRRLCTAAWLCILLAACTGTDALKNTLVDDVEPAYSLIYVIHGDAGYLYHDQNGRAVQADQKALAEAKSVGRANPQAEVFIFHQRPMSHILFFPRKESRFYHFRGGRLLTDESYSRNPSVNLAAEANLYHSHSSADMQNTRRVFLYYGHEIPEDGGEGYHISQQKSAFNIEHLAEGMEFFNIGRPDYQARFDLTVLSTCSNGSPETAAKLSGQTRYLIASPIDLHLSYMDSNLFSDPDLVNVKETEDLAHRFAETAYQRLIETVQGAVGISIYNIDLLLEDESSENTGITNFYRESRFGRALPAGNDVDGVN